ncbi:MAG: RHS repeat-associated core domain-containing protein, partial [Cyclobacteriaceae bacterium]
DEGQSWLQDTDYRYNIRGWLERINDPESVSLTDQGKAFGMQLSYHEGFSKSQYNGNISGMRWTVMGQDQQAYGYTYDAMNRLSQAHYQERNDDTQAWDQDQDLYNVALGYDRNGNIDSLDREGIRAENVSNSNTIDQLTYGYLGNRLIKVEDGSGAEEGFKNGANQAVEYTYDANGNMLSDANKGISSMVYNKLNLPVRIDFDDGRYILNHYTLDGIKRRSEYYQAGATEPGKVTDYAGSVQYENGVLTRITTEEGRVAPDEQDPDTWRYYYNLTDHLGNVRVTVTEPTALEYLATMEDADSTAERAEFTGFDQGDIGNHGAVNNHTTGGSKSQLLRGYAADEAVGLAKSFAVYPGDTVNMEVYAKYTDVYDNSLTNSVNFGVMFLQAFGIPLTGENAIDPSLFGGEAAIATESDDGSGGGAYAYLNYIFYDKNFEDEAIGGFERTSTAGANAFEQLTLDFIPEKEGYLFVYVSNEEPVARDIYFDDLKIVHKQSIIAQTDSYYPFGLSHGNMSMVREGRSKNQFLFNGMERLEDFDLSLDFTLYRTYDPQLNRWLQIDPKSSERESGYVGLGNNPCFWSDPLGDTIILSESIRNDDTMMEIYNSWSTSKAGKTFLKLFEEGGKYGDVAIEIGINDFEDGTRGETEVVAVNKNNGSEKNLVDQDRIDAAKEKGVNVSNYQSKLKSNEYLKFYLELQEVKSSQEFVIKNREETITHEFQHVYLGTIDAKKDGIIDMSTERQHILMKDNQQLRNQRFETLKRARPDLSDEIILKSVNGFEN